MKPRCLPSLRLFAESYHAFEAMNREHLRPLGLTTSQFDIVATLGNTDGMTFKTLGEKTLITKGALSGIVDRLERDGIVERVPGRDDRRTVVVRLTRVGVRLFERAFPVVLARLDEAFAGFDEADYQTMEALSRRLRAAFGPARDRARDAADPAPACPPREA